MTTSVDVKTGSGIIFDSYSDESSYTSALYPLKTNDGIKKENNQEITVKYPNGLTKNHLMASAVVPTNVDFEVIDDVNSIPHMYWDGAFASNTPLRGLIQSHRDWYLNHGGIVPDMKKVYIISLWPRTVPISSNPSRQQLCLE